MNLIRTAKVIALGLTLTQLGPKVVAAQAVELSTSPDPQRSGDTGNPRPFAPQLEFDDAALAALVGGEALSYGLCDRMAKAEAGEGCGGSGCPGANLQSNIVSIGYGASGVPDEAFPLLLEIDNFGPSDAPSARARFTVLGGQASFFGPGCEPDGGAVNCELGDIPVGESVLLPVAIVRPSSFPDASRFQVELESDLLHPSPANAVRVIDRGTINPDVPKPAVLAVDSEACPTMTALVGLTDGRGNPVPGYPPGTDPGLFDVLEEGIWRGPPQFLPAIDAGPLSMLILLDRGLALDSALRSEMIAELQGFAADLLTWNQDPDRPSVQIALMDIQDRSLLQDFTDDITLLDAALAGLGRSEQPAALYQAVHDAADLLADQSGRRVLLLLSETLDQTGDIGRAPALARLTQAAVTAYGFALDSRLEPMMAEIAAVSVGRRHRAESGRLNLVLARTRQDLENQRSILWSSSGSLAARREMEFRSLLPNAFEFPVSGFARFSVEGTSCAGTCTASRSIEWQPQTRANTVAIAVNPGRSGASYSIIEELPPEVSDPIVGNGGIWFPTSRQIRWDNLVATGPTSFSYQLSSSTPDSRPRVRGQFALSGSQPEPTCGDNEVVVLPRYPGLSSVSLFDQLSLAYGEAWKHNLPWATGPSPIPIDYLTRVGFINRGNPSQARWDPTQQPPWISSALPAPTGEGLVSRVLPSGYRPGDEVEIVLVLEPGPQAQAKALEEIPPAGWEVVSVSSGGRFERTARSIRWGLFLGTLPSTVSYRLRVPESATDPVSFSGQFSIDGFLGDTEGEVTLGALPDLIFGSDFEK